MTPGISIIGQTRTGETVHRVVLSDGALSASVLTLGVALQDVRLADVAHSLTVGSPSLAAYEDAMQTCGTIVGPVGNRIGNAHAVINGKACDFDANLNGRHTLHGGLAATHRKIWELADHQRDHALFHLTLPAGEGGFPGTRRLSARFDIAGPTLRLTLGAETDAPTLMNLANHSYWRLADQPDYSGLGVQIAADHYLPITAPDYLPTGEKRAVDNTRFDMRKTRRLDPATDGLWDNNFCLSQSRQPLRRVATLTGPTGLAMDMATTEPGLQVFDGHNLGRPDCPGNDGRAYVAHAGLALEAQFWPDAPNNPDFPDITLHPGDDWQQVTTWTFRR
ncbi:MAG: galactose mutarotase [Rhodobacter sp.]|nr:galactose mutarotase [Rhodobacter sp.]